MSTKRLELRAVTVEDEKSFRSAVAEFKQDAPGRSFGFDFGQ